MGEGIISTSNQRNHLIDFNVSAVSFGNMTQEKLVEDNIKSRTLLISFLRMSSKRKMAMLTKMFQSVRNLRTLADILNTFVSVNTKLMTYSKIS